jgi:segregation and condensation protein B
MKNFDENLEKNTEEENNDDLDQVNSDESDEKFIDKTDENGEPSIEVGNENTTLEQENEISKINEIKSEESEEELLARRIRDYHRNLIEASLYVSGKPLTIEEISTRLEIPKKEVEELINDVAFDYLERSTALVVNKIGDSYQMSLKTEYIEKVSKFAKGGAIAEKYLRTLTVIALKQPILKSLVIKIRGSGAYEHVKYLLDNGLIFAVKKGRSQELTTTDKYAEMFGLPKDKQQMKATMISQLGLDEE